MRFRKPAIAIATMFALILFIAPILIDSNSILPICKVNQASAQTNACLAQDATISAQNVQLLELQITNNVQKVEVLSLRATNTVLEFEMVRLRGTVAARQNAVPMIITVPILITATRDPNATDVVRIVTATPLQGVTRSTATFAPEIQETASSLAPHCILHTVQEGDTPFGIAENYGVSGFDIMEINSLTEESDTQLQIGDVLIVPLEGCTLAAADVVGDQTEDINTVVPTITLPPTAINARVEIVRVISAGDITAEGVEIRNRGGVVDMTGWTLSDSQGNIFTFPQQRLFTNGMVMVYTRVGQNTPIALFWGQSEAVWGEEGEAIVLANGDGEAQAALRLP